MATISNLPPPKAASMQCNGLRYVIGFLLIVVALIRLQIRPPPFTSNNLLQLEEDSDEVSSVGEGSKEQQAQQGGGHMDETDSEPRTEDELPVIVGAGRGTTGTHLAIQGTCALGLASIHWEQFCTPHHLSKGNSGGWPEKGIVVPKLARQFLKKSWIPIKSCIHSPKTIPCPSTADWVKQTKQLLDTLLLPNSTIQTFHDTPFTSFVPYLVQRIKELRGKQPLLILTEREPKEWARRRLETHASGKQTARGGKKTKNVATGSPVCKAFLKSDASKPTSWGLGEGVFDVLGCIEEGLQKNPGAKLSDLFVSTASLGQEPNGEGLLARFMKDYQDTLRLHTAFAVNLFARPTRTSVSDFTKELQTALEKRIHMPHKHQLAVKAFDVYSDSLRFRPAKYKT